MLFEFYLEIPDMPVVDFTSGFTKFIDHFYTIFIKDGFIINNLYTYASKDLFYIQSDLLFKDQYILVRGPVKDSDKIIFFKQKYKMYEFIENKNDHRIYVKIPKHYNNLSNLVCELIYKHHWSVSMRWDNSGISCTRPIKSINLFLNHKMIDGQYGFIHFTDKKFNLIDNSKIFNNNNIFYNLNIEQKQTFNKLIKLTNEPKLVEFKFKEKYLIIPEKIIHYCLLQEHFVIQISKNKCVAIMDIDVEQKNLMHTVDGKLLDLLLMYERDIKKPEEYYFNSLKNKIINQQIGTIFDKLQRMKKLITHLNNKQININELLKEIDIYKFDCCSEIVTEYPALDGEIRKIFYPNHKYDKYIKILNCIDNLISLSDHLPIKNKDPFGLKKDVDYLITNYDSLDPNILQGSKNFFLQRLKNKYPILNFIKDNSEKLHLYKNIKLNLDAINRIINIINKLTCDQHISLDINENNLITIINNSNILYINNCIDQVMEYINNYKIAPYIERLYIIVLIKNKLEKNINIQSLMSNYY